MSFSPLSRPVPLGAVTTFRMVSFVESVAASIAVWRSRRVTHTALMALTDAQLTDIGLHRSEIAGTADRLARL